MRLVACTALLAASACGPPPWSEVVVASVEVRDFTLFTTTLLVNGDYGAATLDIVDEDGGEHVVDVDVRGRGAGYGALLAWGPLGAAAIDVDGAAPPVTANELFGPYYGVRADTAVGVAVQAGAHVSLEGLRFSFVDVGVGLGALYGVDAMWLIPRDAD